MIQLEDKILNLLGSYHIEDVLIGFSIINKKYGIKYYEERIIYSGVQTPRQYDLEGIIKHGNILIKVVEFEFIIHLLTNNCVYNKYPAEYSKIKPPKYLSFEVYEI